MASERQPDFDPVEIAILGKIADLKASLESYRKAKGVEGGLSADLEGLAPSGERRPMDLPVGIFRDKGVKDAIILFLQAGRRKQANKDIAAGLLKGGIATTSENFEATVATALIRLRREGIVLRFPEGWDLAASYPESLRTRLEDKGGNGKASKKRAKAKKPAARKTKAPPAQNRAKPAKAVTKPTPAAPITERITTYLQARGTAFTATQELASQLKTGEAFMRLTLGKMVRKETIEKDAEGRVRLVKKAAA